MGLSWVLSGFPSSSWIDVSKHYLTAGVHRDWQKCKCSYSAILPFIGRGSTGNPAWTLTRPHSGAGASPALPHWLEGDSCGSRSLQCRHQQEDPQLGPSALCRAWQGERTEKEILALLSLPSRSGWGAAKGFAAGRRKTAFMGAAWLRAAGLGARHVSTWWASTRGRAFFTLHLLQRSPFKRSQPSVVVRSLLPHCPACSVLDCCLCGHCTGTVCWGGLSPGALVRSLLPWTILAETAARDPSCLPVSTLCHLVGVDLGDLDQSFVHMCRLCKEAASSCALAVWRLHGSFPENAGLGLWGVILGAEQSSPLRAVPHPFSRQAGACLENPSSRSHWTEEPLCSPFGEVPGTCWGRLSTSQWTDAWLWLGHMVFWSRCSPSTSCPPALQAGEIAQGSDPWGQLPAACGSCQGSGAGRGATAPCLECVPLGSAAQSVWPCCWVTIPGEVWLCRGLALLARDLRKAHHVVRVSKQHFRFAVKDACVILGTPVGLRWKLTLPASQESLSEPESLALDSWSYPVNHSYQSCYILPDFSSSLCCFSHSVRLIGWGIAWGSVSAAVLTVRPCGFGTCRDGKGGAGSFAFWQNVAEHKASQPSFLAKLQIWPLALVLLWLFLWAEGSSHSCCGCSANLPSSSLCPYACTHRAVSSAAWVHFWLIVFCLGSSHFITVRSSW